MMGAALDVTLELFRSDRAWLIYPATRRALVARRHGAYAARLSWCVRAGNSSARSMDAEARSRTPAPASDGALLFGPSHEHPLPARPA